MKSKIVIPVLAGALSLALGAVVPAAEEIVIQGHAVELPSVQDQGQAQDGGDQVPLVQDLGDGQTNDGGVPDATIDARDAALENEQNLGPNAPGYIP